jgi:hypothetical protein
MPDELNAQAHRYASRNRLTLREKLGAGIHGQVQMLQGDATLGGTALKVYFEEMYYRRELAVYNRLKEAGIRELLGFAVPQLIRADDELLALEMTVVERPYVLDFAGAYLDQRAPRFDDEVWETWEADKREKFGSRWPEVQAVLAALKSYGIEMPRLSARERSMSCVPMRMAGFSGKMSHWCPPSSPPMRMMGECSTSHRKSSSIWPTIPSSADLLRRCCSQF